ncbi:exopolygalacturonase [Ricinus communis]|uniref:exopolygalacturonase n=1 Tax=Ricinus communis TaxID=3988 RepID=UPI00201A304B|nr:exopolygalacturonase [Ricinus communis]
MSSAESPGPASPPPEGVFDITQYGAIADGKTENSKAFLATWEAACRNAGNSTFYIPEGTYIVGPISFSGPCYKNQSPEVKIEGTLVAPSSLNSFLNSEWIEYKNLNGLVLTGRTRVTNFDGQGAVEAWKQISCWSSRECKVLITSLKFSNVSYGTLTNISMVNSKSFHVSFHESNHITVRNIIITAPGNSPNTDGIHIGRSTNISIVSSAIGVGDDCISIGPGSINITIFDVRCGPGHGLSIGSLGKYKNEEDVIGITVQNCTINGTQNGVRVKTWPGSQASIASNMTFEDIVMVNVSNPVIIDQEYCPASSCDLSKPSLVKLSNISVKNVSGTYNTNSAVTLLCSSNVPCENIKIIDVNLNNTVSNGSTPRQGRLNLKGVINGFQVDNSRF